MAGNWWFNDVGTNLLQGEYERLDNPTLLPDDVILDFLVRIPAARPAFLDILPSLKPQEQERLMLLYDRAEHPPVNLCDDNVQGDGFQHRYNTSIPVRTTGCKLC